MRRRERRSRAVGVLLIAVVVSVGLASCGGVSHRTRVTLTPQDATVDVPFDLRVSGLRAREAVTLSFSTRTAGRLSHGSRVARADGRGGLILSDQYLLAQMHPAPAVGGRLPAAVRVTVRGRGVLASATARRRPLAFDGSTMQISDESPETVGFLASWARPKGVRHRTAILLLGGSEGGLGYGDLDTALLAHGYSVLHLAYFGSPGLPSTLERIPLQYFQRALRWLAAQPEVDRERIVAFGVSRGGELALILASTFPRLVHGAVGYVPSFQAVGSPLNDAVPTWTYRGRPVIGVIPVEQSSGPVFVAGGGTDRLWPSGRSVQMIARRMHRHGRSDIVALDYHGAGHLLGTVLPAQVIVSANGYGRTESPYGTLELGGGPLADEMAREDAWPRLLRFLAQIGTRR